MKGKKGETLLNELDALIHDFNAKFGMDKWQDGDKVMNFLFKQLPADFARDEAVVNAVKNSDKQNAKITSDKKVKDLMQEVIYQYTDLYKKFTENEDFKRKYLDAVFTMIRDQQNNNQQLL